MRAAEGQLEGRDVPQHLSTELQVNQESFLFLFLVFRPCPDVCVILSRCPNSRARELAHLRVVWACLRASFWTAPLLLPSISLGVKRRWLRSIAGFKRASRLF